MIGATMRFYVHRNEDGSVHVQNALMGHAGQHHVHSPEGFDEWRSKGDDIVEQSGQCNCDLSIGQVRDANGRVWDNPKFN